MDAQYLWIGEWLVRVGMAALIIQRRRAPSAALAWLAVVAFVPVVGAVAYFLVGENRLGGKRSRQYGEVIARVRGLEPVREQHGTRFHGGLDRRFASLARLAEAVGAGSSIGSDSLQLLSDTDAWRESLVADIDSARQHCHLLYFIVNADGTGRLVADALIRAARRGVGCRLMTDAVGSKTFLRSRLCTELADAGVDVVPVMPVNPIRAAVARLDLRNHRKLAVIDGRVAYAGSHNLSDPIYPRKARYGAWVDASVRLTGPVVHLAQEIFIQDWALNTGSPGIEAGLFPTEVRDDGTGIPVQVLPTGPASRGTPLVETFVQAIASARSQVVLTTPYFVPDEAVLAALRSAALRGVDVSLIVPRHSDHGVAQAAGRSHYGYLLDVGVAIHQFTAGLLHAKTLTVDQGFAMIGSANLDVRSFMLNFELAILVYDAGFAQQMHELHADYLARSEPVSSERWRRRGWARRFGDNVAKLLTPLL